MKKALITGIRGMDASLLAKYLLDKGYQVIGTDRRCGSPSYWRLDELGIFDKINLVTMDITDSHNVNEVIKKYKPDEIYHLAGQSFVQPSFNQPKNTLEVNTFGTLNVLEAIKNYSPSSKMYFASTSETFGKVQEIPQTESTFFYPRSPYGVSKLSSFWLVKNYRESYGLFVCSGILFNHENSLRSEEFVTRKITKYVAEYDQALTTKPLYLGNIYSKRDWGDAWDYIQGMHLMLQTNRPDDFILATNETHTVKEFVELAFKEIGIDIYWEGEGIDEKGYSNIDDDILVKISPDFFRPCEVDLLIGDYSKAKEYLGWEPTITFKELIKDMVKADIRRLK